jgi:GTP cyclohydrolase I
VERAAAEFLRAMGLRVADEAELGRTPARVADLYQEVFSGVGVEIPRLATFPHRGGDEVVVVRDLPLYSMCVHHLIPFFGTATVAYLPKDRIIGISGVARLLRHVSRRPQLQERIGRQVADHLQTLLRPRGVAVILEARHLCMEMRGVKARGLVETRIVRGALARAPWSAVLAPARGATSATARRRRSR